MNQYASSVDIRATKPSTLGLLGERPKRTIRIRGLNHPGTGGTSTTRFSDLFPATTLEATFVSLAQFFWVAEFTYSCWRRRASGPRRPRPSPDVSSSPSPASLRNP